jgi:hypothetical protein
VTVARRGFAERLDHVGLVVRDLAAAHAAFTRLGLALTPFSRHSGATTPGGPVTVVGTGNHCAMFRSGYLELIAIVDPGGFAYEFPAMLARYEGLHIYAFGTSDPDGASAHLAARGFSAGGARYLERTAETPAGPRLASFRNVFLPVAEMPEGYPFYIEQQTPEVLWQPGLLDHPLGVEALTGATVCVADLEEAAARYERFFGFAPERAGGARVSPVPGGRFTLVDPAALAAILPGLAPPALPWGAAFTLACRDLAAARRLLDGNGVATTLHDGRVIVPPPAACGAAIVLEQGEQGEGASHR